MGQESGELPPSITVNNVEAALKKIEAEPLPYPFCVVPPSGVPIRQRKTRNGDLLTGRKR